MFSLIKATATAGVLTASLGAAGLASGTGEARITAATAGPVRCEILVTPANGMIALAGVVHADVAIGGSYSLHVSGGGSGGSSNITQGGPFAAVPGEPVALGSVMVSNAGANYDATLEVTANGAKIECRERIGGLI